MSASSLTCTLTWEKVGEAGPVPSGPRAEASTWRADLIFTKASAETMRDKDPKSSLLCPGHPTPRLDRLHPLPYSPCQFGNPRSFQIKGLGLKV